MTALATILGAVGAILTLVGLVGGGFTFSGSVMPKVVGFPRVLSFGVGSVLLLAALGIAVGAESTPPAMPPIPVGPAAPVPSATPAPTDASPVIAYVVIPNGYTANVMKSPSSTTDVITALPNGATVQIVCTAEGESVTSPLTGYTSTLWDGTMDGGFIPDVFVDTGTNQPTQPNCLN